MERCVVKSIIPWIGGKRRLAKDILPLFPKHTCYVEPFAGGAAFFFMKEPSKVEVINDLNHELITLYRVVQNHLEEFLRQFKWALTSRKIYEWLQETPPDTLTDIQRAARFYYLQRLSFGGKVRGQSFGTATTSPPRLNLLRIEEELSDAHIRLARVFIEDLPWHGCIDKYDRKHTFFYCDPPYWQTEGYGIPFPEEEYVRLAEIAQSISGRMLITVNAVPLMRSIFKGLKMRSVKINYTVGSKCGKAAPRKELIIQNW